MIMLDKVTGKLCRVYELKGGTVHYDYRLVVLGTETQPPVTPVGRDVVHHSAWTKAVWRTLDQLAYVRSSDLKALQQDHCANEAHSEDNNQEGRGDPQPQDRSAD